MPRFIKAAASLILTACLLGCSHSPTSIEAPQESTFSYDWHDGSKGGAFGLGEGWWVSILHAEYESITEIVNMCEQTRKLIVLPAEYEWVKDDSVGPQTEPEMTTEFVTIPGTHTTVTEPQVIEPARTEYDLVEPVFSGDGTVDTPAKVKEIHKEAVIELRERHVVKIPAGTQERLVPVEHRTGYRRVMRVPVRTVEDKTQPKTRTFKNIGRVEVKPWRFVVAHSKSGVSHTFESYKAYTDFAESLK